MNLKKKLKAFVPLARNGNGGFTLVELIVVIAIIAILGGVAVPAYSGYVEKANMQADISLASEVEQALLLQYYAAPQQTMTSSVVLSESGATVAEDDTFAATAMQDAFGDSWATSAKLVYDKWGNGATVAKSVIAHFVDSVDSNSPLAGIYNGTETPSFAADVEDLYQEVEDVAIFWGNDARLNMSGAELMQGVADATLKYESSDPTISNADAFANNWGTPGKMELLDIEVGVENSAFNGGVNYAMIKARNAAIGTYLKNEKGYSAEFANALMNYSGADGLPIDVMADDMVGFMSQNSDLFAGIDEDALDKMSEDIGTYWSSGKAKTDGLAYYAMMDTVKSVPAESNDETYWDDMSGAISLYAAIAAGEANLEDLNDVYSNLSIEGNSVAVTLMVVDGNVKIQISPNTAKASK